MISIETTAKLLKLHLQWPERRDHNAKDSEAMAFFTWLFMNYHDRPEVMALEDEDTSRSFSIETSMYSGRAPKRKQTSGPTFVSNPALPTTSLLR